MYYPKASRPKQSNPRSSWWLLTQDNPPDDWCSELRGVLHLDNNRMCISQTAQPVPSETIQTGQTAHCARAVLAVLGTSPRGKHHVHAIVVFPQPIYRSQLKVLTRELGRSFAKPLRRDSCNYRHPIDYVLNHVGGDLDNASIAWPDGFWHREHSEII